MPLNLMLSKKVSSFFSLLLVFLFAFVLGTIIRVKSSNLKKLEKLPVYTTQTGNFMGN